MSHPRFINENKDRIFRKRERELIHAVKNDYSHEKLEQAAENLREAKLRAIKARLDRRSVFPSHTFTHERMGKLDKGAKKWIALSTDDILEMYHRYKT